MFEETKRVFFWLLKT